MNHELMAPIMFAALAVMLLLGYPVAFTLAANGLLFGWIGIEMGLLGPELLQAIPERIFGVISNDTLLAVPFFTYMGLVLERSGMAEDLLDTIGQLFGPLRGGLAVAVTLVGAVLAATTGVVAASVIAMGLISLPVMMRYGYDRRFSAGIIAASGTLAQIIPPSLVLIVLADQMGTSVGDMYHGAIVPGLLLMGLFLGFILLMALFAPQTCPALPPQARTFGEVDGRSGVHSLLVVTVLSVLVGVAFAHLYYGADAPRDEVVVVSMLAGGGTSFALAGANRLLKLGLLSPMAEKVVFAMVPPLMLIFLVLGTIFVGISTPTEGGAMGATGAMVLALAKRRLSWKLTMQAIDATAKLTTFVMFILIGARVFSLTFYAVDGHRWIEHLLTALPGGVIGFLVVVNLLVFALGCFLDFFEIAFILIPLLAPVAQTLGIDLIWFGVMIGVNLQTSFLTPPFGFSLFYLRSVAPPSVMTTHIYRGAVPFVVIQLIMVGLLVAFPELVSRDTPVATPEEIPLILDQIPAYQPPPYPQ